jgi:ABC-2 type transport system permease protein
MNVAAQPAQELREITGPSAFGGGWTRFWRLTWLMSVTDFKLGYLGTFLGYIWSLMRPLLLFGVYYLVFTKIFRFGGQIKDYPVLLLFNIMLFTFFTDATTRSVTAVVTQEGVVRKTQFPRIVIPLSVVLTAGFNMCLNLVAVLIFMLIYGVDFYWTWFCLPLIVVPLAIFTTAVSMILSATFVRFRDVAQIWTVVATALFYGAPALYTIEVLDGQERLQDIVNANPLSPLLEQANEWFIDPDAAGALEAVGGSWARLLIPAGIFLVVCVFAVWIFNREAPRIAEEL